MTGPFPLRVVEIRAIQSPSDHFRCPHLCGGKTIIPAHSCIARQNAVGGKFAFSDISPCRNGCMDGLRVKARLPAIAGAKVEIIVRRSRRRTDLPPMCPYCKIRLRSSHKNATCGHDDCIAESSEKGRAAAIRAAGGVPVPRRCIKAFPFRCDKCGKGAQRPICYDCRQGHGDKRGSLSNECVVCGRRSRLERCYEHRRKSGWRRERERARLRAESVRGAA